MQTNVEIIVQKDGYKSKLYSFYSSNNPKLCILILHGMAEHNTRYTSFAKFLNQHDIDVYLYDHRGHGTETSLKNLGYVSQRNGDLILIDDAIHISNHIQKHKRTKPFFLMGHSMGSLIARNVIQSISYFNGVILCGTTYPSWIKLVPGMWLGKGLQLFFGSRHPSPLLHNMIFGSGYYKKLIKRTSFDWLSRDNNAVGAYIHDPYCGFICAVSFYHDLLRLAYRSSTIKKQSLHSLPIFLISGSKDPVGAYGKEVNKLALYYKKTGVSKLSIKLYEDARHELLQEINKDEVYMDIVKWLEKTWKSSR